MLTANGVINNVNVRQTVIGLLIRKWLYCVECPQYNIRLEVLVYVYI